MLWGECIHKFWQYGFKKCSKLCNFHTNDQQWTFFIEFCSLPPSNSMICSALRWISSIKSYKQNIGEDAILMRKKGGWNTLMRNLGQMSCFGRRVNSATPRIKTVTGLNGSQEPLILDETIKCKPVLFFPIFWSRGPINLIFGPIVALAMAIN